MKNKIIPCYIRDFSPAGSPYKYFSIKALNPSSHPSIRIISWRGSKARALESYSRLWGLTYTSPPATLHTWLTDTSLMTGVEAPPSLEL